MSRYLSKARFRDSCFFLGIFCMLLGLVLHPAESVAAAKSGVELSMNVILPSLFPFFVLSTLCIRLNLLSGLDQILGKFMRPLFHLSGSCSGAYLLGIVGGYPVGARTAIGLYESGQCSKAEAERMLSFCNNSGPAFILGVVGAGVFSSSRVGLWLYGAHVAASILVGILFRNHGYHGPTPRKPSEPSGGQESFYGAFPEAVKSAFSATLNICAFVIFFTVVIRLLFLSGLFRSLAEFLAYILRNQGISADLIEAMLSGFIEMTSGVWSLRDAAANLGSRMSMAAFILGWAGLSVHCQVLSFIGSSGLSTKTYFFGKLLHGIVSGGIILILSKLLGWDAPVSQYLATEVTTLARLQFPSALFTSLCAAAMCWVLLTVISAVFLRKSSGNSEKKHV